MFELSYLFTFEAAHFLPSADDGHHNKRVHGHSFKAEISFTGTPNPETGIIVNLEDIGDICKRELYELLDHRLLNEIEGLEHPTLENISYWIWKKISPHLPPVSSVTIHRESCFQKCKFVPSA